MKLTEMYEKRKSLNAEIDTMLKGSVDTATEARASQLLDDLDGLDAEIRVKALRDRFDAGGIQHTSEVGRPALGQRSEFRDWIASGHRNGGFELRAVEKTELGGTTDIASDQFTQLMARDSVVRNLATVIGVDDGSPLVFYRQTAQFAAITAVVAEAGAFITKDSTAQKVTFTPTKMGFFTTVSTEALQDMAYDVAAQTIAEHAELHAANRELSYCNSTYSAFAQVIWDNAANTGNSISGDTGATAAGIITPAEAAHIVYGAGLKTAYLKNASWLLPPACWSATLSQTTANTLPFGSGYATSLARDGAGYTFLGFPVFTSTALPTPIGQPAASPFAVFGDIARGYRIVEVSSVPFLADPYSLAGSGQVKFLSETRSHGQIMNREAMVAITA